MRVSKVYYSFNLGDNRICFFNEMKEWAPLWGPILTALVAVFGVFIAYKSLRRQIEHSNVALPIIEGLTQILRFHWLTPFTPALITRWIPAVFQNQG